MTLTAYVPGLDLDTMTETEYDAGTKVELLTRDKTLAHPEPRYLFLVIAEMGLTNTNRVSWYFYKRVLVSHARFWLTHNDGEPLDLEFGGGPYDIRDGDIGMIEPRAITLFPER